MSESTKAMTVFDDIFGPGSAYIIAMNVLRQKSELTYALKQLKQNGTFQPIRIGKKKVTAMHPASGRQFIFRFLETLDFDEIVIYNSFSIKREFFLDGLSAIDPVLFICVNHIVFVQTDDELGSYVSSIRSQEDLKEFIQAHNGAFISECQDTVINTMHMWPWVREHEPDAGKQPLLFLIFLFDVVLHEVYHAHQYNPLISQYFQEKTQQEQEKAAEAYVEQYLPGVLRHLELIA